MRNKVKAEPGFVMLPNYRIIYDVIRQIPRGAIATYGQIAELAGFPGGARVAAAALKVSRGVQVPWQRVVGKFGPRHGRIAIYDPVGAAMQKHLLEREKVFVDDRGRISLTEFGWLPGEARRGAPKKKTASRTTPR